MIFVPVGYFKEYDGISQSKELTFETKFEAKARETFNLCFEHKYKGKPSGLAFTQADKWVHIVPLNQNRMCCYQFSVDTLRATLKNYPTYYGGDNKQSELKLLPIKKAEEIKEEKFFLTINWNDYQPYW